MIIPYYNCLLLGHKYNEIELTEEDEELIKDYLEEYLWQPGAGKEIQVTCLGLRNASIISRAKNLLHVLLMNLSVAVYQLGNNYTASQEQRCLDEALRELVVKPSDNKGPAIIENLSSLKLYFSTYRSQEEMKTYLKQLLVKEVNHERRCITYREAAEAKSIIQDKLSSIKGNIEITQTQQIAEKGQIFIIMANQKSKEVCKLQELIKNVQTQFPVNKQVNQLITQEYTLHYLLKNARESLHSLFAACFNESAMTIKKQAIALKNSMGVWASLKAIAREGLRLAEEETKLQQEFLQFVAAMNAKYSNEVRRYLQALKDYAQFKRQEKQYFKRRQAKETVCKYFKGILQQSQFKVAKEAKQHKQCSMVQNRILAFLENTRQEKLLMNAYLQQKLNIKNKYNDKYQQIMTQLNEQQLHKLSLFNRYKYGFSCCLYVLGISNKTNHYQFQPSSITNLLRKASKHRELFTKIRCSDYAMQIGTIEGKVYRIGEGRTARIQNAQDNEDSCKENVQSINHSYQSIINQFDSVSQVANSRTSLSSLNSKTSLAKKVSADKEKCTKIIGKDYEFKIDENGKLYGKGRNKHGQLGIDNQQNAPEFTLILPLQKIRKLSTDNGLTIVVTSSNKIYHFGKGRGKLPSSRTPIELKLRDKFIVKQLVIAESDVYFLTDLNKVYSLCNERTVRIPKEMELAFDEFRLIKTGGSNIECTYLVGFWVNNLDAIKRAEIEKYLTGNSVPTKEPLGESMLVDEEDFTSKGKQKDIHELSAILEESSF